MLAILSYGFRNSLVPWKALIPLNLLSIDKREILHRGILLKTCCIIMRTEKLPAVVSG